MDMRPTSEREKLHVIHHSETIPILHTDTGGRVCNVFLTELKRGSPLL